MQCYFLAFCHGLGVGVYNLFAVLSSSASKGTIKGWAFLYLSAGVLLAYLIIFGLLFISGVSGLFPVFSCVFGVNSLIINTIHFSGLQAIAAVVVTVGSYFFFLFQKESEER